ncbi:Dabb family protein [Microcella sp.]|uniref:Dabb family protein n=1 Tax=Microcella sp. TaxID=1913979 RepID=UPI003919D62B
MIRHIVLFRLAATDDAQRRDDAHGIAERLEALETQIAGIQSIRVDRDLGLVEGHWDVALVSEHDDNAALEAYQAHPAHKEAAAWIGTVVTDRAVVDYSV